MADNSVEIEIKTIATGDGAEKTVAGLQEVQGAAGSSAKATEELGQKTHEAGEHAVSSRIQHMALHHAFQEIDKFIPGLGSSMSMLMRQLHATGHAAEHMGMASKAAAIGEEAAGVAAVEAVPGVAAFGASIEAALAPLLPFLLAMLAIQEAMKLWDGFSEKSKAAAEATAEACKKIQDSVHEAAKAVRELEEAMHPGKKTMAAQDAADLQAQLHQNEEMAKRQRALNKAQEHREEEAATTPEAKAAVKQKFVQADKQIDDWLDTKKAQTEHSSVEVMDAQLAELKKKEDAITNDPAFHEAYRKSRPVSEGGTGDASDYNKYAPQLEENAKEAKALREKRDEIASTADIDTKSAAFASETNRQTAASEGQKYNTPSYGSSAPGMDFQGQLKEELAESQAATRQANRDYHDAVMEHNKALTAQILKHLHELRKTNADLLHQLNQSGT